MLLFCGRRQENENSSKSIQHDDNMKLLQHWESDFRNIYDDHENEITDIKYMHFHSMFVIYLKPIS